jgi:hypothetical protein
VRAAKMTLKIVEASKLELLNLFSFVSNVKAKIFVE